jgi:ribosomal protein S18 acetylase RimI-like enzyme
VTSGGVETRVIGHDGEWSRVPDVTIRHATVADVPALVALFVDVVDERRWLGTEPGFDQERINAGYMRTMDDPSYLTLVADDAGTIVGTLRLYPRETDHTLGMLIAAGYRGQGLGTRLVADAVAWARARGSAKIVLGVFPHNVAAQRLYESAGFHVTQRRAGAYTRQTGEVWDLIELELAL